MHHQDPEGARGLEGLLYQGATTSVAPFVG